MTDLAKHFPDGVSWEIHYDTTRFIKESTREVVITLLEAIALVVLVVFVFLQNLRSTLIPTIAIPVSLIGTFAVMLAFGFSINTLTLLGLVVAVALVVDDAIVVVENVNRHLENGATDIRKVTEQAMAEVRGPIIATTLVLMAVFVPVSFIPGMTGLIYNQFALTIAIAVGLSGINSLTLSPALAAVFLRAEGDSVKNVFFRGFNRMFDALSNGYARSVETLSRMWILVALVFAGLVALMVSLFGLVPTAFVPPEDQGYVMVLSKLPAGATIERTKAVAKQVNDRVLATPGVATLIGVPGYDLIDGIQDESASVAFVVLDGYSERNTPETKLAAIVKAIQRKVADIPEARIVVANAPPIPGLGSTGGFNFEIQDLNNQGPEKIGEVLARFLEHAQQRPEIGPVFSPMTRRCRCAALRSTGSKPRPWV
jgi:HAE1 family hydrophobic/amphiphilic exporter-1